MRVDDSDNDLTPETDAMANAVFVDAEPDVDESLLKGRTVLRSSVQSAAMRSNSGYRSSNSSAGMAASFSQRWASVVEMPAAFDVGVVRLGLH